MNGKHYPKGVVEATKLLEQYETLQGEIEELRLKARRFNEAQTELAIVDGQLRKMLEEMDLESQGNAGFGGRMGWFLLNMRRVMRGQS